MTDDLKRKDFKDKTPLGLGSSRMVFELTADSVVKFSRGRNQRERAKGKDQNAMEHDLYHHLKLPILCPVLYKAKDDSYLIMKRAITIGKRNPMIPEQYREQVMEFQKMMSRMYKLFKMIDQQTIPSKLKKTKEAKPFVDLFDHPMFQPIYSLIFDYDMIRGDLFRKTSWGLLDGKFVLIDYGLNRDVYDKYYSKKKNNYGYMEELI